MTEGKTAKQLLEDVLTPAMVREVWTVNFGEAIPFTLQDFSVGALLPAVLYMFRRGHRRGAGGFQAAYQPEESDVKGARRRGRVSSKLSPSVTSVARVLAADARHFSGFDGQTERDILADLLLCHCLENQRHESGRDRELIRAFPTHYMSAWIDLPQSIGHLPTSPGNAGQPSGRPESWRLPRPREYRPFLVSGWSYISEEPIASYSRPRNVRSQIPNRPERGVR